VDSYIVTATDTDGNALAKEVSGSTAATLTVPDDGLILGATYAVTVRATNTKNKTGPDSDPADAGTVWMPAVAPAVDPPSSQNNSIHVTWTDLPTEALQGGALVGYRVQALGYDEVVNGTTTDVPGTNGQAVQVTVAAVTEANGEQQDGAASDPASGTPGRGPAISGASVSAAGTNINWSFSMSDVGDPVANCVVTKNPGGEQLFNGPCPGSTGGSFAGGYSNTYSITVNASAQIGANASTQSGIARTDDPPTQVVTIADAYLGGTWARDGSGYGGTWGSSGSRPPGGVRWIGNGSNITINCTRRDAGYTVQIAGGTTQTWYWWVRLTDGTWVRSAALQQQNNDGPFPGVIQC
jgi:hypothetical protein